jgi:cell wall-associated NlpC family hydrolase
VSTEFLSALDDPTPTTPDGSVVGLSPQRRLALAMRTGEPIDTTAQPGARWSLMGSGVANPYGPGIHAYEPDNVLIDSYRQAKAEADASKAVEEAGAAAHDAAVLPPQAAHGQVSGFVNAALALAQRRVPYVWGGTSANGVDCSGLIYYAARSAGIQLDGRDWPRLRAVDYGRLGTAVSLNDARPGDIIYFDEPGGTDHVGIYLGNGQMVQAPTTGDVVKVSSVGRPTSIRRIFDDNAFGQVALPSGLTTTAYNGTAYNPGRNIGGVNQAGAPGSTITRPILPTAGGNVRARAI